MLNRRTDAQKGHFTSTKEYVMLKSEQRKSIGWMTLGLCMGLLVAVGVVIGSRVTLDPHGKEPLIELPERLLHASATHGSEEFAVATGPISDDSEGIFFLDYLTGELNCYVLYPRFNKFGAHFNTNVVEALGVKRQKSPKYVMVTGVAGFRGGSSLGKQPGNCVVYIADANTGTFACYGIPWNKSKENNGILQQEKLVFIAKGTARHLDIEE